MCDFNIIYNVKPLSYYKTIRKSKFGMYVTKEGRVFRKIIKDLTEDKMKVEDFCCVSDDVEMTVIFYHDNRRCNDLDNSFKTIGDCLNKILYDDDKQIKRLILEKKYDKKCPRIELSMKKYE